MNWDLKRRVLNLIISEENYNGFMVNSRIKNVRLIHMFAFFVSNKIKYFVRLFTVFLNQLINLFLIFSLYSQFSSRFLPDISFQIFQI